MLNNWKTRHHVSDKAFEELIQVLCYTYGIPEDVRGAFVRSLQKDILPHGFSSKYENLPESLIQKRVRVNFQNKYKAPLWRNNVGGDKLGNRWGLANETKAQNKVIKSADLIGITPFTLEQLHTMGMHKVGVFTSLEVKRGNWKYRGTPEEKAQLRWANLVKKLGGLAEFINNPDDV